MTQNGDKGKGYVNVRLGHHCVKVAARRPSD